MASESVPWCLQNVVGGKVERRFVWGPRNGELWCGQAFPLERGSFGRLVGNATSVPQRVDHMWIQERQELVNFNGFWSLSCPDLKIWEIAIQQSGHQTFEVYFCRFLLEIIPGHKQWLWNTGLLQPRCCFCFSILSTGWRNPHIFWLGHWDLSVLSVSKSWGMHATIWTIWKIEEYCKLTSDNIIFKSIHSYRTEFPESEIFARQVFPTSTTSSADFFKSSGNRAWHQTWSRSTTYKEQNKFRK